MTARILITGSRNWTDCAMLVRSTLVEAEPVAARKWEDAT